MTPERHAQIQKIFEAAIDLPKSGRSAYLEVVCSGDPELRLRMDRLIEAAEITSTRSEPLEQAALPTVQNPSETRGVFEASAGGLLQDRYRLGRELGRGTFGVVYLAHDERLHHKPVVIKFLTGVTTRDEWFQKKFEDETKALARIDHPGVVGILDAGQTPTGTPFLVMQYVEGVTLRSLIEPGGMPRDWVGKVIRQIGQALAAAHSSGVLHRDLKPENIMVQQSSDGEFVRLIDFGIATIREEGLERTAEPTRVVGSLGYMAPEQFGGRPVAASDIYAMGVISYELLVGKLPFPNASPLQAIARQLAPAKLNEIRKVRPDVPDEATAAIRKALSTDPADRFQNAHVFGDDLEKALATIEAADKLPPEGKALATQPGASSASRLVIVGGHPSRRLIIGSGVAAAALGAGASWLFWPKINGILHPLPEQRFVALMAWPPEVDASTRPLLRTVLDAIGNRLARAELAMKRFTVMAPGAAGQAAPKAMADVVSSLGANLVLGASLRAQGAGYGLGLRVFDAASGVVLRIREARFASAEVNLLAERSSTFAAELLDVPPDQFGLKDQDEMSKLPPVAYKMFSEAEDLRSQPNDTGLDAAIEKYQKVLEAEPPFALGYADLSLAYSRKFQVIKDRAFLSLAEKNAVLALQYNPQSAKGMLATAVFDLHSGSTQRAMDGFAKALQLDPSNPQILIYKARAFADLGQLQEEEIVYREIIRKRPNYWPAYNDLGNNLYRQTRYREAAISFAEAAAVAPRVALPLANQGTMYLLLNQDENAEDAFRRSLERAPNEFAYSNLGSIAFKRGNVQRAIEDYTKALDLNPKNFRTWRNLADCYAILGDSKRQMESYAKAAETLSDALRVNPQPGANWTMLAFYHAKLGRRSDAEADLKIAEKRGLDPRAQFTKAQTLAVLGRKEEALELVLKCIDQGLSPVDVELAMDLKDVRADPKYRRYTAANSRR